MSNQAIKSIQQFIDVVREDSSSWPVEQPRWFRGEPESEQALIPTLYRDDLAARENDLLQTFRARAPGFHDAVPHRDHTDQWLFMARHVGLPTRLLDWSESALFGLHFALKLQEKSAVVWMLNPLQLNYRAHHHLPTEVRNAFLREFPLPWVRKELPDMPDTNVNGASENINGAWQYGRLGFELPVAVHPTYVHPRLRAQRSCFTIHGKRKEGVDHLVPESILKCYHLDPDSRSSMLRDLQLLGVTDSVVFPDLDGLASELVQRFS